MLKRPKSLLILVLLLSPALLAACGDDDPPPGSEAVSRGVGAACAVDEDCREPGQSCLNFKGGYCGVADCQSDPDCPQGSACVTHTDGANYCFLLCANKLDCNLHRPVDDEANCVSSIVFVDEDANQTHKACEPPSG